MPFQPAPDIAQVTVFQRLDGQNVENVFHFHSDSGPITAISIEDLATGVGDYWGLNMLPQQTAQLLMHHVTALDLSSAAGVVGSSRSGTGFGGQSNDFLPNNVAVCMSLRTGLSGRSFRGRSYFAGLTEQQVTGNDVEPDALAAIEAAYTGMLGSGTLATGWSLCILSRVTAGAPRLEGVSTLVTSALVLDSTVDSQRRRLPGRGR